MSRVIQNICICIMYIEFLQFDHFEYSNNNFFVSVLNIQERPQKRQMFVYSLQ